MLFVRRRGCKQGVAELGRRLSPQRFHPSRKALVEKENKITLLKAKKKKKKTLKFTGIG